jgi:hypothetical protein
VCYGVKPICAKRTVKLKVKILFLVQGRLTKEWCFVRRKKYLLGFGKNGSTDVADKNPFDSGIGLLVENIFL